MAVDSDNCNQSQNVTKRRRCQTSPLLASSRSRGDPKPLSAESECSPKRLKTNTSNPKPRHASHSPPRVEIQHADCEPQRPTEEEIAGEIREYQKITSTLREKPWYAPFEGQPKKILDLGSGDGEWVLQVSDLFNGEDVQIIGVDQLRISELIPPRVEFVSERDCEGFWTWGDDFDIVHLRCMMSSIKDVSKLCRTAFKHTRPGGFMEWQELHLRESGKVPESLRTAMESAGFTKVQGIVRPSR